MKIYKIDVNDLNCLDMYGFKRNSEEPAHIKNVYRLDDYYRCRFPQVMQQHDQCQYVNFRNKTDKQVSDSTKRQYWVPEYFIVKESEYGKFEYHEVLLGIPFYIPSEVFGIMNTDKQEISSEEALELLDENYIRCMGNLFYLVYPQVGVEAAKERLKNDLILKK